MKYRNLINYDQLHSTAEHRFKNCVINLVEEGIYPGPQRINEQLHGHSSRTINGRECKWRREICHKMGFKLNGRNLDG